MSLSAQEIEGGRPVLLNSGWTALPSIAAAPPSIAAAAAAVVVLRSGSDRRVPVEYAAITCKELEKARKKGYVTTALLF